MTLNIKEYILLCVRQATMFWLLPSFWFSQYIKHCVALPDIFLLPIMIKILKIPAVVVVFLLLIMLVAVSMVMDGNMHGGSPSCCCWG